MAISLDQENRFGFYALRWVFPGPFDLAKHFIGKSQIRIKKKSQISQILSIRSLPSITRFAPIALFRPILPVFSHLPVWTMSPVVPGVESEFGKKIGLFFATSLKNEGELANNAAMIFPFP